MKKQNGSLLHAIGWFIIIISVGLIVFFIAKLTRDQMLSVIIFTSFISGSLFYWHFRNAFAFIGLTILLGLKIVDVEHLILFANFDIILFLAGMMIVIIFLEEKKFFDWLIYKIVIPFEERPSLIIGLILFIGTIMAALVDEVTSILFMTVILVKILACYDIKGRKILPFLLFLIFTTNIGSSALPVGNPVGVIIAFHSGFTIEDFIRWALPIAIITSLITTFIGVAYLKKKTLFHHNRPLKDDLEPIPFNYDIKMASFIFILVISGLILHSRIEELLGLEVNTMLLGVPLFIAGFTLLISGHNASSVVAKVDWWTLLYFMCLFAAVGTLVYTGVINVLADMITNSVTDLFSALLIIGLLVGILTAFMDNVVAVATIAPVISTLANNGLSIEPLWWILLIAGTYLGNATVIGSTANIVCIGIIEKSKIRPFSQWEWIKIGVPISLLTFFIAFGLLYIQL